MSIQKPYKRIYRPFLNGDEFNYITDSRNADDRINLIRGYHLLEKELYKIFDYIEPTDDNKKCYSHQVYALLLRAATEFEANAKAILSANGYKKLSQNGGVIDEKCWGITDYYRINAATKLSEYSVTIPIWNGSLKTIQPLNKWASNNHKLTWYQSYNSVKHNRHTAFPSASIENAVNAVASVFCIVFAQFNIVTFNPHYDVPPFHNYDDEDVFLSHESRFLTIKPPSSWRLDEKYLFDWDVLKQDSNPFQSYSF